MADVIDYQIIGDDLQLVEIELDPGEGVQAEVAWHDYLHEDGIEMQTGTGGGLLAGLKRAVTVESFFITTFTNKGSIKQHVAFAAPYPGKIVAFDLETFNGEVLCQKDLSGARHRAQISRWHLPSAWEQVSSAARVSSCNA